jgi:hypothetical protein
LQICVTKPTTSAKASKRLKLHQYLVDEAGIRFLVHDDETDLFSVPPAHVARRKIDQSLRRHRFPTIPGSPG